VKELNCKKEAPTLEKTVGVTFEGNSIDLGEWGGEGQYDKGQQRQFRLRIAPEEGRHE